MRRIASRCRPIETNEPVLKSKVSGFGGRAILSSMIAPDMRAMTIRINDVSGVAGFVLPGDHVDIILIRDFGGSPVTDILLQNIKVLGIDQDANQNRQQPGVVRAVTFEVTPTQSQKLVLAQTGWSAVLGAASHDQCRRHPAPDHQPA